MPKSPLDPSPKQVAIMATRNDQPCITTFYGTSLGNSTSLSAITRRRLVNKEPRTFTIHARGSRTPNIRLIPPYTPNVPTNPGHGITMCTLSLVGTLMNPISPLVDSGSRTRPAAPQPVHSTTMSLGLYRHTDPLWGYQAPSLEPPTVSDDGGLDGD